MSTLRLKLAGLALISALGASAAHAQDRYPPLFSGQAKAVAAIKAAHGKTGPGKVDIIQQGKGNGAAVGQNGPANGAVIKQRGDGNTGQIQQTGAGNSGSVYQLGRNNDGAITQTGDDNVACLVQLGNGNSGAITQSGGQSVGIAQTRVRSWEFPAELCALNGGDPRFLKRVVRRAAF